MRVNKWLLFSLIWTLAGLTYVALQYLSLAEINRMSGVATPLPPLAPTIIWGLAAFYLYGALSPFIVKLTTRFPLAGKQSWRNALLHVPAGGFFIALHTALWCLLYYGFQGPKVDQFPSYWEFYRAQLLGAPLLKIMMYIIILIVIHAVEYYRKYRTEELTNARLRERLSQAELQALKMQLNPHFLFNTLNAIAELTHKDPTAADRMIAQLSNMLRLSLERSGVQEIRLKQELEFLEKYLAILQTRFGDRLRIRMEIPAETLDAYVPNMILQPLVENAVRHGIAPLAGGGLIEIASEMLNGALHLRVTDNGRGMSNKDPGLAGGGRARGAKGGVGLLNTRARLEHLYDNRGRLELSPVSPHGLAVSIYIPFYQSVTGGGEHD